MSGCDPASKSSRPASWTSPPEPGTAPVSQGFEAGGHRDWLLLGLIVILITYGSLYPLHFVAPASPRTAWNAFLDSPRLWTSPGDVMGNILLFLPLGAVGAAGRLPASRHLGGRAVFLLACLGFALAVQAAQICFPPRQPALSDALWNAVGVVGGLLGGRLLRVKGATDGPSRSSRPSGLVLLLLGSWGLAQLVPFVPAIDWQQIKLNLRLLLTQPGLEPVQLLYIAARVLGVGMLLAAALEAVREGTRSPAAPGGLAPQRAFWLALLLGAMLLAKLLLIGQRLSLSHVLGYLAGFVGWWLLQALRSVRQEAVALPVLWLAYSAAALSPLQFRPQAAPLHLWPLEALLQGSMTVNVRSLLEALFVFGTMLWLAQRLRVSLRGFGVALCLWVGALEWLQRWLPGRTADLTMPLLVLGVTFTMQRRAACSASQP